MQDRDEVVEIPTPSVAEPMTVEEPLKIQLPAQGWRQFLINRSQMLDAFDQAREKAKIKKVQTTHGKVAEAEFRKWLSGFLPKRYGVTSGYIISQGVGSEQSAPHFDVIIYDALNSPVLWFEDDPDTSKPGTSRAVPAEYVKGVLEVKSSFRSSTVSDGVEHLSELAPLMSGDDEPSERYKLYLPPEFFAALCFMSSGEMSSLAKRPWLMCCLAAAYEGSLAGLSSEERDTRH